MVSKLFWKEVFSYDHTGKHDDETVVLYRHRLTKRTRRVLYRKKDYFS